jgi:hypothetical protein
MQGVCDHQYRLEGPVETAWVSSGNQDAKLS